MRPRRGQGFEYHRQDPLRSGNSEGRFSAVTLLEFRVEGAHLAPFASWHATALGFSAAVPAGCPCLFPSGTVLSRESLHIVLRESAENGRSGVETVGYCVPSVRGAYDRAMAGGAVSVHPPYGVGCCPDHRRNVAAIQLPGGVRLRFLEEEGGRFPHAPTAAIRPAPLVDHLAFVTRSGEAEGWARLMLAILGGALVELPIGSEGDGSGRSCGRIFQFRPLAGTALVFVESAGSVPDQISEFLAANNGPGLQHVAFATGNIHERSRRLQKAGTPLVRPDDGHYAQLLEQGLDAERVEALKARSIIHDPDSAAPIWQLFTERLQPNGLFYELIRGPEQPVLLRPGNVEVLFRSLERTRRGDGDALA